MRIRIAVVCGAASLPLVCFAQVTSEKHNSEPNTTLSEVLVTGEYPGPGLWKVSKNTDAGQHVLWILGAYVPTPKAIKWRSQEVETIVADSQEIITNGGVGITFEKRIGIFKTLSLLPSILRARKNPDGQSLKDMVPADVYNRWLVQKAKYIGRDVGVEKWRPTFAANELQSKALKKSNLNAANSPWTVIRRIANEHKIKITSPTIFTKIPNEKIKSTITAFLKTPLLDVECFATTIAMVEALGDTETLHARGMAWATGDLAALRRLPALPDARVPCEAALMNSQVVRDLQLEHSDDLPARLKQQWVDAVDKSLTNNRSTFAVLPISELLDVNGRLAVLRAKGYVIEAPSQVD